jgi:hypothetical protein
MMLNFDSLVCLWDFAIAVGTKEESVVDALLNDGVRVLELNIKNDKAFFADKADLAAYIARNAKVLGQAVCA